MLTTQDVVTRLRRGGFIVGKQILQVRGVRSVPGVVLVIVTFEQTKAMRALVQLIQAEWRLITRSRVGEQLTFFVERKSLEENNRLLPVEGR